MRLTPNEISGIVQALSMSLSSHPAELRLFGSRVDDTLKGGDIDLLLIVANVNFRSELISNKHYLLADIKAAIGEQKIDLKIVLKKDLETDPFLKLIYPTSILIWRFSKSSS